MIVEGTRKSLFFFQAEDGIRDYKVTGVQTCALPILLLVVGNRLSSTDAVAAQLRFARVHRKLNRFDEADAAYTEAGDLATLAGDRYAALLSRIGRANTMLGRGNLADAERSEEHTSELQSPCNLVCRLLLEK